MVYLQITNVPSPNLHCRCIWHGWTNWQIHPWLDLLSEVTGVTKVKMKFSVNWGGTNHNCCTQRLVILHSQTYQQTQKPIWPILQVKIACRKSGHEYTFSSQLSLTDHWMLVVITITAHCVEQDTQMLQRMRNALWLFRMETTRRYANLFLGLWSGFISRSMYARSQVSVCSSYDLFHRG